MSSSCRKRRIAARAGACGIVALAIPVAHTASAAQYYLQPQAELAAESHSNITLDAASDAASVEGYVGTASAIVGIATPRSETTLTPRLRYRDYPDLDDSNSLEGWLDLASSYRTARSTLNVFGRYQHEDGLTAELPEAQFDSSNSNVSTTPETGRVRVGATRQSFLLGPSYRYAMTQRWDLDLAAQYQRMDYNPDDTSQFIDFDFYQANAGVNRKLTELMDLGLGAHAGHYRARLGDSTTDFTGVDLSTEWRWSKTFVARGHVTFEQYKMDQTLPLVINDTKDAWGADFSLERKLQISTILFNIGRTVTPSGSGGMYYADQVRVEYDRQLSQRLTWVTAVRFLREDALSAETGSSRDYLQGEMQLKWLITPTFYVRGGYRHVYQEYESDPGAARDHVFSVSLGYQGLAPQR